MDSPNNIFDRLLSLPLFSGLSHDDVMEIAGHNRLDFLKQRRGTVLVNEGDPSDRLLFLINGTVAKVSCADDKGYTLTEYMPAPYAFQIPTLFGIHQHFTATYVAQTDCGYLSLEKRTIMQMANQYLVFRLNLLGILAVEAQRHARRLWNLPPATPREAIVRFISVRSTRQAGEKLLKIKMTRLAAETGYRRLEISKALASLAQDGLIEQSRGMIRVPALERLIQGV